MLDRLNRMGERGEAGVENEWIGSERAVKAVFTVYSFSLRTTACTAPEQCLHITSSPPVHCYSDSLSV
jgi:hypothetical protein